MEFHDLSHEIKKIIQNAIEEDIRSGDITSIACIPEEAMISGRFIARQTGVLSGLPFLPFIFHELDPRIEVNLLLAEGTKSYPGRIFATVSGPARGIFAGERVALNLLQHSSGITSLTAEYVEKVHNYSCQVFDTRKTLPGLRALEKYAVRVGGGSNHRSALDERFIIKQNHLKFIKKELGSSPMQAAVAQAKAYKPNVLIEIEVSDFSMLKQAMKYKPDIIMLDHWDDFSKIARAVNYIDGRAFVEAVGGINLDTAKSFAETGLNGISISGLIYSAPPLEISLCF